MRQILSADKANDLAQKANSSYMIASYIKTIQDKYFRLDEEELVQVLNRLIQNNVSAGKRRFVIDVDSLCNEFREDRKLDTFECDWDEFKAKNNLETKLGLLNNNKFKQELEKNLWIFKHKQGDSVYLYNKIIGREPIATNYYVTKISNANRYITLALKILNLAGYDARRPYIFHRWSKIIVKLPEKGKIENV